MIKYRAGLLLLFITLVGKAQTFTRAAGYSFGNMVVMNLPYLNFYPNGQLAVYVPSDYYTKPKPRPLYIFNPGDGEMTSLDITQITNTALPQFLSQGLIPYNIDPVTKDTIKWIIVSQHNNAGQSYAYPQLQYLVPWILDKSGLNIDTNCVWMGGLSGGGNATWSIVMGNKIGDTLIGKRITGIMPESNGGYDQWLSITGPNLAALAKSGLACLYIIGQFDPGNNAIGYQAYDSVMRKYCQVGKYYTYIVPNGTHSANTWNLPFPLTNHVWPGSNLNSWELMWSLRRNTGISTTPVPPSVVPYPVRLTMRFSDSTCKVIWQK